MDAQESGSSGSVLMTSQSQMASGVAGLDGSWVGEDGSGDFYRTVIDS